MTTSSELLYRLTIHFPLRIREFTINSLSSLIGREYAIKVSQNLLKGKALMGVLPDGNRLFYPLDDSKILPIILEIYYKGIYDVRQIDNLSSVCDVGAHIGVFTLRMSKQAPNSMIVAIEPDPTNLKFLSKNIIMNHLADRVKILNAALGEKKEKALIFTNYTSRGDNSMKRWHDAGTAGSFETNVITLADVLATIRSCDLMKIDVEGMEAEVLNGSGDQHLAINRLIVEIHISIVHIADICEWLRNHDFLIKKTLKLYNDCVIVEAQHLCA